MSEKHFNGLSPAEAERLALLLEELGEAQQAIGKILRHGYESHHPAEASACTNRRSLEKELGDVQYAIALLEHTGDLDGRIIDECRAQKGARVGQYLHHQAGRRRERAKP